MVLRPLRPGFDLAWVHALMDTRRAWRDFGATGAGVNVAVVDSGVVPGQGGLLPAVLAAAVGSLLANWFFVAPRGTLLIADPANVIDLVMMRTVGDMLQNRTWETLVENVAKATGGEMRDGVQHESDTLHGNEARSVEEWADSLVVKRKRAEKTA